MKPLRNAAVAGMLVGGAIAIAKPLPTQQPAGVEQRSRTDAPLYPRTSTADRPKLSVVRTVEPTPADSNKNNSQRRLTYAAIGGVLGALIGAVAGNQYAQAHKPPCVNVPAGPPCRYLDADNSSSYRVDGIGLGAGLGALLGLLRAR